MQRARLLWAVGVVGVLLAIGGSLLVPARSRALIDVSWTDDSRSGPRVPRVRAGVDLGGGAGVSPRGRTGGGGGVGVRAGLQIDEQWSTYLVGRLASVGPDGLGLGALMLALGLTPIDDVDLQLAVGYAGVWGTPCDVPGECGEGHGVGAELRASVVVIGLDNPGDRLGIVVLHAIYTVGAIPDAGAAHLLEAALGVEWF